jgi:hypothetical protein
MCLSGMCSVLGLYLKANVAAKHYFTITMANGNAGFLEVADVIADHAFSRTLIY